MISAYSRELCGSVEFGNHFNEKQRLLCAFPDDLELKQIIEEEVDEYYFPIPETMVWECKRVRCGDGN